MSCEEEQFSGRKEKSVTEITVFFVWVNLARNFLNMGSSLSSSFSSSSSSSSPLSKAFKRRARKRLSTWEINHKRKKMNYSEPLLSGHLQNDQQSTVTLYCDKVACCYLSLPTLICHAKIINWLQYVFQGRNPILLLSIQSGVRLIEVLTIEISQIQFILVSLSS